MEKIVFLDLEETIIRSWSNRVPCNIEKVKDTLAKLEITDVRIFSFAVDNAQDVDSLLLDKEWLENIFGFKIISVPTVEEIMKVCLNHTNNHFEMYEFKSIWGKTRAFQDYCNAMYRNCTCYLLDDIVQNTSFINYNTNLTINTIRI